MKDKKKIVSSLIQTGVVVALTVIVFKYIVIPVKIDGVSMENSLHDQDIALINAWGVKEENIHRFDVAVLQIDLLNEKIIKRVIGLPGETVECKNDVLYINGVEIAQNFLDEKFIEESKITYNSSYFTEDFKVELADDEYFVMGDNRLRSTDSRALGAFHIDDFIGIDGAVIYPFSSMQWLK